MSHVVVQRTVVRMLYDPAFAHAVYTDRDAALAGLDLTPAEQDALVLPDARAYATDPYRRARALHGLFAEYPTSAWLTSRATRDVRALDAFFSAPEFHDCIATRGSLAAAFGAYLQQEPFGDARIAALSQLESAIARVRRALNRSLPSSGLITLSPRHAVVELPSRAAALHEVIAAHVRSGGDDVSAFLLRDSTPASHFDLSLDASTHEFLHIEGTADGGIALAIATPELAQLLLFAAAGRTHAALATRACELGAEPTEADAILEDLIHEGILLA